MSSDFCPLIGPYQAVYLGRSKNKKILQISTSGGVVTTLLIYLLQTKKITGAIVTTTNKNKPWLPKPIIAFSKKQILAATQSKYIYSPILKLLPEIKKREGKFAFVGSPCHLKALANIEQINPSLKNKIVIKIGLFCHHALKPTALDFIFSRYKIDKKQITQIKYRAGQWPGKLTIWLENKKKITIPTTETWGGLWGAYFFTPKLCLICEDALSSNADISVGDAWLPEVREKKSLIIVRTKKGKQIIHQTATQYLEIKKVKAEKVLQSAATMIFAKNKKAEATKKILNKKYTPKKPVGLIDYLLAKFSLINATTFSQKKFWSLAILLKLIAKFFLLIYFRIYRYPGKKS
ncbi:Coenzyme F420 hydrogenase/dehydrogenase, beta subunit C-terminal domain [bacterium]|nr:Coenzyme F420 hydrogenase/dehydrogenase, beta subunit C-terminal domain [bacterium]